MSPSSGERLIVMGLDLGVRHHGVAVVGSQVYYSEAWDLPGPTPLVCSQLRQQVLSLINTTSPVAIAIEDYHGRRIHTAAERGILLNTGAVCSLQVLVPVILVAIQAWQDGIVGQRPVPRRDGGTSRLWKDTVRTQVGLALQARGIRYRDDRPDPGGHMADSMGLAIHSQDMLMRQRALRGAG